MVIGIAHEDIQDAIDTAVKMATRLALNNHPVNTILWFQPQAATDSRGTFVVIPYEPSSDIETKPWEK